MGATLASLPTAVWAHLLAGDSSGLEQAQLPRLSSSDAFHHCGSPPPLSHHWEAHGAHEMDYSSHQYMMAPPPGTRMSSHVPHLSSSTVQWTTSGESHHSGLMQQQQQHCSDYQETFAPHQDRPHIVSNAHVNHLHEASEDVRDAKRPAVSSSLGSGEEMSSSEIFTKRPRLEQAVTCVPFKVRKEKLGERITALQQLVSPFGKTDTASVLLEAIGYIKFLQEQVQVLSTPYMKPNVVSGSIHHDAQDLGSLSWPASKAKSAEDFRQDLRSRGLCLVPVSCTLQVANDNGADFWTPAIGGSCR